MPPEGADPAEKCPVDPKTREKWLEAAKAKGQQAPAHPPVAPNASSAIKPPPPPPSPPVPSHFSLDTGRWEKYPAITAAQIRQASGRPRLVNLSTDREISTIPRSNPNSAYTLNSAERAALPPANSEADTGHDRASGNWIYPSQEMFFAAMKRKGHDANPSDMTSIVPIHNAVNERAWKEIKEWEAGRGAEKCGGPSLVSFAGDSKALTPRARWNSLLGYQTPFDRHDWVIDRCGTKIDYVIDFYAGKGDAAGLAAQGKSLSFYLDVRPKLNTWEGIKMRALKSIGM